MTSIDSRSQRDERIPTELSVWIRGASQGEQESQSKIYQRVASQVGRIVRRIVGQDHADDIVQDFFVSCSPELISFDLNRRLRRGYIAWLLISHSSIFASQIANRSGFVPMLKSLAYRSRLLQSIHRERMPK